LAELLSIATYPLTGAREFEVDNSLVGPAGLPGDRVWVCYSLDSTENVGEAVVHKRVGRKECAELAALDARIHENDGSLVLSTGDGTQVTIVDPAKNAERQLVYVSEFGDLTPCYYAGDGALAISGLLQRPGMRLARKAPEWLKGDGIDPSSRKVAPIHIVNKASVEALAASRLAEEEGMVFDEKRFRPNFYVGGLDQFEEASWIGGIVAIGDVNCRITSPTPRCVVTGMDPESGRQMKDVPKVLRDAVGPSPRSKLGDFGVYAYPLVDGAKPWPNIALGDEVKLVEKGEQ
jgi:uncharacterized protein